MSFFQFNVNRTAWKNWSFIFPSSNLWKCYCDAIYKMCSWIRGPRLQEKELHWCKGLRCGVALSA